MIATLIARGLCALLVGSTAATQAYAFLQHYDAVLGAPIAASGPVWLYGPWQFWQWAWWWLAVQPRPFAIPGVLHLVITGALLIRGWTVGRGTGATKEPAVSWSTLRELKQEHLLDTNGFTLGRHWGRRVCYGGEAHTLVVAPSGSNKTQSVGITSCYSWQESLFLNDPKAELHELTAAWRAQFSRVIHLNPTSELSDCYDPVRAIRLGTPQEIRDGLILAEMLANPDGKPATSGAELHFRELTMDFLLALILHGLYMRAATTLLGFDEFFMSEANLDLIMKDMATTNHTPAGTHRAVQRGMVSLARLADRERSSMVSTAGRALRITLDPLVAKMTSRSSFSLTDVRQRRQPMTIYLTVPYADQERLKPLSRVIIRQILDWTTQGLQGVVNPATGRFEPWQHRLGMLIDEVQTLGEIPALRNALTFVRGYGVNLCLITPSLHLLGADAKAYMEGSHIRLLYAPNEPSLANLFSSMTGKVEVEKARESMAQDRSTFFAMAGRRTHSTSQEEQPLLSPTEMQFLKKNRGLLLVGNGGKPALIKKAPAYKSWRLKWQRWMAA